jgi:hypothetical protein
VTGSPSPPASPSRPDSGSEVRRVTVTGPGHAGFTVTVTRTVTVTGKFLVTSPSLLEATVRRHGASDSGCHCLASVTVTGTVTIPVTAASLALARSRWQSPQAGSLPPTVTGTLALAVTVRVRVRYRLSCRSRSESRSIIWTRKPQKDLTWYIPSIYLVYTIRLPIPGIY